MATTQEDPWFKRSFLIILVIIPIVVKELTINMM